MGNGDGFRGIAEAEVLYQAGDGRGAARVLGPVPAPRLRHHIPQALQTGPRLARGSLLDGTALPQIQPTLCVCKDKTNKLSINSKHLWLIR